MIYRLHGTIQPYAWGGHDYIPQLLRREPSNLPAAELWFGDHPLAPSQIEADGITLPFNDWLQKNLSHALTPASRARRAMASTAGGSARAKEMCAHPRRSPVPGAVTSGRVMSSRRAPVPKVRM